MVKIKSVSTSRSLISLINRTVGLGSCIRKLVRKWFCSWNVKIIVCYSRR